MNHPPDTDTGRTDTGRTGQDTERRAARREARRASVPPLRYPPELPVSERHDDLLAAIRDHQVVIVAGETGSGKSTQLPKLCLEAGRGLDGFIGHTQPRRIAARAVAERVASELGEEVGGLVGYAVRFTDRVSDRTLVKVMTDGILLAEIQRDRMLRRYDTIIIDEAHERSLNIDFLLGYLTRLRRQRPDLKIIITSATIDTERFARHFDDAPVISVTGRTYPVEVRYRPLEGGAEADAVDRDQIQGVCDAVDELCDDGPGDILVFLSGEREIRDTADALRQQERRDTEILPLYARLSMAEQHRVFSPHRGRRVVLATNVAETSLTVPGIRSVVDTGTARISRYNRRTKVQRLPIEAVSQASANQRAGRCGRIGPGICIRLYAENDFATRPPFTEPEILRTNLASVILQMAALQLGDMASFPFVEPPDRRAVKDGITLLEELGALDPDHEQTERWLTPIGRRLARLPIDPRLGRMILEADHRGCVRQVSIIAAALSIQDPRERPTGQEQAAAEQHRRFRHPDSDLLAYLNLWTYLQERQHELSSSALRRLCRNEYLNYLRVREWQDLVSQLRSITNQLGIATNHDDVPDNDVTRCLLAGLLSQIGLRDPDRGDFLGARGARLAIAPGSALQRKPPRWIMAAELVETNRLWARGVSKVQPEWVERLAPHLLTYHYSNPTWSPERAATMAVERVSLYGLPIIAGRRVDFGRIDAAYAREQFIRHGLVEGDWSGHHRFLQHNREVLDEIKQLQDRTRRYLAADDDVLHDFYDARVGAEVVSGHSFDRWWKRTRHDQPHLLEITAATVLGTDGAEVDLAPYPDHWNAAGLQLPLHYRFAPGEADDGITVEIALTELNQVRATPFAWLVPGLRTELVGALIRQLPKPLRKEFVPIPDHSSVIAAQLDDPAGDLAGDLVELLARRLSHAAGQAIPAGLLRLDELDDHLRMNFRVLDTTGKVLGEGRDLDLLAAALRPRLRATLRRASADLEQRGRRGWEFGTISPVVETERDGKLLRGYPALVDEGDSVGLRVLSTPEEQSAAHWDGTRRLLRLTTAGPLKALRPLLGNELKLAAARLGVGVADFAQDCVTATFDHLLEEAGGPVWDADAFEALRRSVGATASTLAVRVTGEAARLVVLAASLRVRLEQLTNPLAAGAAADLRLQLDDLVHAGFVAAAGIDKLADLRRYLQGVERRLDKVGKDPHGDAARMAKIHALERDFDRVAARWPAGGHPPEVTAVRWLLEELRVATFAQVLGTPTAVSENKVRAAISELDRLG